MEQNPNWLEFTKWHMLIMENQAKELKKLDVGLKYSIKMIRGCELDFPSKME